MNGWGRPPGFPKRGPRPFAFSPMPAEFAPWRPICPASVCITIVGFPGWVIRRMTTVEPVCASQSQFCPQ